MKKVYIIIILVCLNSFLYGCSIKKQQENTVNEDNEKISEEAVIMDYVQISQEEAKRLMDDEKGYIILDVRTYEEYDSGHITGAICIPNETIKDTEPEALKDKDQLILVYCRSGNRSKKASEKLASMGYSNVKEFGGINTWEYGIE